MKKYFLSLAFAATVAASSQAQRTPQLSSAATVTQTVGITDFSISYSRPNVKERVIFGDNGLVPFNEVWRTGANMATSIESSTDFTFGGVKVPAGKYALFSIPTGEKWTVILNKNWKQGGTAAYKEAEDVARTIVTPGSGAFHETFTLSLSDITDNSAKLNISWASVTASVLIEVATESLTLKELDKTMAAKPEDPLVFQNSATYLLSIEKDLERGLALTDKSIGLKESYRNVWLKSQILAKLGKTTEAITLAKKAIQLGPTTDDGAFSYFKGQIENNLTSWQAKAQSTATEATKPTAKSKKKK
jgi:hypothetical protein